MSERIRIGDLVIAVTRKDVKHVHLSVHPPTGRVTLVTPSSTRPAVARAYAVSKLAWIRDKQAQFHGQARETPRAFVERESHYLWGRRYLLSVVEKDEKPSVKLDHRRITLHMRPGSRRADRERIFGEWHRALLHEAVPTLIRQWETKLGVVVSRYFLQRMKTKWGSCNHRARSIRLNTELVKKPKDMLEYVVVHEMVHLLEPTHSERFVSILTTHYPTWRDARAELNELPLASETWRE